MIAEQFLERRLDGSNVKFPREALHHLVVEGEQVVTVTTPACIVVPPMDGVDANVVLKPSNGQEAEHLACDCHRSTGDVRGIVRERPAVG
jgi:hypothetical protein